MTITKKIDFSLKTPYEDKELFFERVTIFNITYGTYPTVFDVILTYGDVKISGKLHIDQNCKPEFKFDMGDFVNEITDRKNLSWAIFLVYVKKAVSLFYGKDAYRFSSKKFIGINLKWLRKSRKYSLKKGSRLLNIDEELLNRIENNASSQKDIRMLNFSLIKKVYGTDILPIPTRFLISVKFKPIENLIEAEK